MLRCERSEPRSIHQDRVCLLQQTLRGPASPGTSGVRVVGKAKQTAEISIKKSKDIHKKYHARPYTTMFVSKDASDRPLSRIMLCKAERAIPSPISGSSRSGRRHR